MKALGATCDFYAVDIGQFQALKAVVDECYARFGKINGVIHCAGVPGGGVVQLKSKEKVHDVFSPKVHGAYNLARALKKISPDFVVFMSSIVALTGEPGQVEYCGANACLDTFATSALFFPAFVCSINWNTWTEVGMAVDAANSEEISFIGRGNDLSTAQGQSLFLEILQKNIPNIAISNFDVNLTDPKFSQKLSITNMSNVGVARQDLNVAKAYLAPSNRVESKLAQLWQETLGVKEVGCLDDFFELGGHSLKALGLIEKINKAFDCKLTINHLLHAPTIKELSSNIMHGIKNQPLDVLLPLKLRKKIPPYLFLCHPASGMTYCFDSFVMQYDFSASIYGLQDPSIGTDKMLYDSLHAMAKAYLVAIKKIQPQGPYLLLGYSFGGNVLYEVAHLLQQQDEKIGLLALIDSWASTAHAQQSELHFREMFLCFHHGLPVRLVDLAWERMKLLFNYIPSKMNQEMVLFKANRLLDGYKEIEHTVNGWSNYNSGKIICYKLDADHETIMNVENSQKLLNILVKHWKFN